LSKDLKDLEKELKKSVKKSVELGDDLAKDLKKSVKSASEDFEKAAKVTKKTDKKDKDSDWFVWALIIFLFAVGLSPIALILLLVKLFGGDKKKQKSSARRSASAAKPKGTKAAAQSAMKTPATKESTAKWLKVGGIAIMVIALLGNWDSLMWFLSGDTYWWSDVVSMLGGLVGGGAMLLAGRAMSGRVKRYAKYLLVMGDRESVSVEEFSRTLGISRRKVERDLENMIDAGYFGGRAYLHRELGYLLRSGDAGSGVQQAAPRQAPPQQPADEVESEYAAILRKIRLANDRIEDEALSAKIDRIESITAGIFRVVEQEPEKKSRIQTFLNYYLPTTQKLLDSYAEFEAAGVEGANVRQAKQRIELTMDKIIEGFEHQLDELYRAEAMDVDSDIRVMESMLRRDTATVEKDFGTAVQSQREIE